MKVDIYYNVERDEQGRSIGMMDGFQDSHRLAEVTSFEVPNFFDEPYLVCEFAYKQMQRIDGETWIDLADLPVRSMCVGDVIVREDYPVAYAIEPVGIREVDFSCIDGALTIPAGLRPEGIQYYYDVIMGRVDDNPFLVYYGMEPL